jgi:hypothetical protein
MPSVRPTKSAHIILRVDIPEEEVFDADSMADIAATMVRRGPNTPGIPGNYRVVVDAVVPPEGIHTIFPPKKAKQARPRKPSTP